MTMSPLRRRVENALVPVKLPIAARMGDSLSRESTDVTADATHRSCLVLAPHPDDETLGCGATLMRKIDAGTPVHVVVFADGAAWPPDRPGAENIATRDAELRTACAILGLPDDSLTHLSFPETHLDTVGTDLVDAVADAVRTHRPDEVLVTSVADPHSDHVALAAAAGHALARTGSAGSGSAGTGPRLLAYPIWQWTRPRSWKRTLAASSAPESVRTDGYLDRKQTAIAVFHSQMSAAAGGEQQEGLTPGFLDHFVGPREIFFPVPL
jgi:LmbE family N-acetylglucosaminyl deacetylase